MTTDRTESDLLAPWRRAPWPYDWVGGTGFGRRAPLVLEIGFGNGAFLAEFARTHPDVDCIGIEVSSEAIRHLVRRVNKFGLDNVRIMKADARVALSHVFAPDTFEEAFVNHPDPWPKERHFPRRLLQSDFLRLLGSRMKQNADLTIATDHAGYAGWIVDVLEAQDLFTSKAPTTRVADIEGRVRTKYEMKALEQGISIHYFTWKKTGVDTDPPPLRLLEVDNMPNVTFRGPADLDEFFAAFEPATVTDDIDGLHVVVKQVAAWRQDERTWMVESVIRDGEFTQHVGVVVHGGNGKITVRPAAIGFPRTTPAVKRAVDFLAQTIGEKMPHLVQVSSTV